MNFVEIKMMYSIAFYLGSAV